ncbi:MAG: (Fe-S)-binding protein [Caldilineae bacterium]|nr:MAG: (Fe-S)-binding protein [Caldilineae bacterium]
MLTPIEKIVFVLAVIASLYLTYITFRRMVRVVMRGEGELYLDNLPRRLMDGLVALFTFRPVFKTRLVSSLFHGFIGWGFLFYFLVNALDVLGGYFPAVHRFTESGGMGLYRLLADVLSVGVLVGMTYFLIRRFVVNAPALTHHENVKLHPHAAAGMRRDSLIVGLFILFHVGFRFLGESFLVAQTGHADPWQPFASAVAGLWGGFSPAAQTVGWHISWWLALGLILAFIPYFPYSKHIHLMVGPFNFATRPRRRSIGEMTPLDFEDESIEQFGVATLTQLSKTQLVDAFACIMCNRCQDVCPAYTTGKELSPSALEINKRYGIKEHFVSLANGDDDPLTMLEFALSESALWACTTCGACSEICPVGNEPFRDILDVRRNQVLMESQFPAELQAAFRGMERNGNPWQMANDRMEWAEPLDFKVPTVDENPNFDVLYWVGCAASFDPGAQKTARALATILHKAGVNFAVLGNRETCTGDTARRAGNEYLFYELANMNVETLNEVGAKKIITACPHCLHTLKNEYPAFGGNYQVMHHSEFINQLVGEGKLKLNGGGLPATTFHDPCYLGRHNQVYDAPRQVLAKAGAPLAEMPRTRDKSFCCGAGGAQMWKEEEHGAEAVNANRYREARATGAQTVAVGCPFCNRMLTDANAEAGEAMQVRDIAEIVADALA